jgi:hypothetical protein
MLLIAMPERKKVLEHRSGLCPSEKELPEQCSGAFHHKNTPGCNTKIQVLRLLNVRNLLLCA